MGTNPPGYMRMYRAQLSHMQSVRLYLTPGYVPPRVRSTYKEKPKRQPPKTVFRMSSFSGDPSLKLMVRP